MPQVQIILHGLLRDDISGEIRANLRKLLREHSLKAKHGAKSGIAMAIDDHFTTLMAKCWYDADKYRVS